MLDLLSVGECFLPSKRRAWVMKESFFSKICLTISLFWFETVNLTLIKWEHSDHKCVLLKFPQLNKGLIASWMLCRNYYPLGWLKPAKTSL